MPEPTLHIWEPEFIQLWQQGATYRAIAQALGCPLGTVASRSAALAAQGKIQPRPRGGAYSSQRRQAALARVSPDTPPVQYLPPSQDDMRPLLTDILLELRQLTGALADRVSPDTPGVHRDTPRVSTGVSARTPLPAERGKSVRWNLHLSEQLRTCIKARAEARGLQDSQMVEELLWLALAFVEGNPDGPDQVSRVRA
jgi:DNA-binding transcriptional MocR family regulator